MTNAAAAREIGRRGGIGAPGRRAASAAVGLSAPVVNMGLEEIQKQAKAS